MSSNEIYTTFIRSCKNWQEFANAKKKVIERHLSLDQAREACKKFNDNLTAAQEEAGTKMEFTSDHIPRSSFEESSRVRQRIDRIFEVETTRSPHRAFNVYRNGRLIDTVFYSGGTNVDVDEVTRSLINHDGYPPDIEVKEERRKRTAE